MKECLQMNRNDTGRRIVHISILAPYNEGWGYQENLLPHYHKLLGNDVTLITTTGTRENGKIIHISPCDTVLPDGVRLIRLQRNSFPNRYWASVFGAYSLESYLDEIQPDFILFHGLQSVAIYQVIKYKRAHPDCVVAADSHSDNINQGHGWKQGLLRCFFQLFNLIYLRKLDGVYGVTPLRADYAKKRLGAPTRKTSLLLMGGDIEHIPYEQKNMLRHALNEAHSLSTEAFVIVSGGKMDEHKMDATRQLARAIDTMQTDRALKLVLFGVSQADAKFLFSDISHRERFVNIGWLAGEEVYRYFLAADLVVFPGTHSVLWEQAVCSGVPCVFREIEGMHHVDVGGNCAFLRDTEISTIQNAIRPFLMPEIYETYQRNAIEKGPITFSYLEIARRLLTSWDSEFANG